MDKNMENKMAIGNMKRFLGLILKVLHDLSIP